jgi:hypothetical protein
MNADPYAAVSFSYIAAAGKEPRIDIDVRHVTMPAQERAASRSATEATVSADRRPESGDWHVLITSRSNAWADIYFQHDSLLAAGEADSGPDPMSRLPPAGAPRSWARTELDELTSHSLMLVLFGPSVDPYDRLALYGYLAEGVRSAGSSRPRDGPRR